MWPTDTSKHFHTSWHWCWKLSPRTPCRIESWRQYLWWKKNYCRWWLQPWNQKMIASWQESCGKLRQYVKKQRHYSVGKGPYSQGYVLPSGHVCLWVLGHKEGRMPENWSLQTVVLEKTLQSSLGSKEIKPVNLKGNLPWILVERTDAEAPVFWLPNAKNWLIGKVPDAGKDSREKEEKASEDEMAR